MRFLIILMLSGTLGVLGCDSDEGTGGAGGSGGEAGTGGGGGSGGAGLPSAAEFCDDFAVTCSYGSPNYDDRADCLADYDAFAADAGRQACVVEHLGFAEDSTGAERDQHCGHASGLAPCN